MAPCRCVYHAPPSSSSSTPRAAAAAQAAARPPPGATANGKSAPPLLSASMSVALVEARPLSESPAILMPAVTADLLVERVFGMLSDTLAHLFGILGLRHFTHLSAVNRAWRAAVDSKYKQWGLLVPAGQLGTGHGRLRGQLDMPTHCTLLPGGDLCVVVTVAGTRTSGCRSGAPAVLQPCRLQPLRFAHRTRATSASSCSSRTGRSRSLSAGRARGEASSRVRVVPRASRVTAACSTPPPSSRRRAPAMAAGRTRSAASSSWACQTWKCSSARRCDLRSGAPSMEHAWHPPPLRRASRLTPLTPP